MLEFDIGDRDVVVLSNYRSGSSAFGNVVSRRYGLTDLGEALHRFKHQQWYNQNKKAKNLVKIMPDHYDHPEFENIMTKSFVIGLSRRDAAAQISSLYISDITGIWHRDSKSHDDYEIDINRDRLEAVARYVLHLREKYELMRGRCDVQLEYEDILDGLKQSLYFVYQKPQNHQELLAHVQDILEHHNYTRLLELTHRDFETICPTS